MIAAGRTNNGSLLVSVMKHQTFDVRLSTAKTAKQAMVAKFRQRPGVDDPAVAQRREERAALSAARDARLAERELKRVADEARIAAEREAHAAQEAENELRLATEKKANDVRLEAEQKAARDARYAARKARK